MTLDVFLQEVNKHIDPYYQRIFAVRKQDQVNAEPDIPTPAWSNVPMLPKRSKMSLQELEEFIEIDDFAQQDVPQWATWVKQEARHGLAAFSLSDLPNATWFSVLMSLLMLVLALVLQHDSDSASHIRIHYGGGLGDWTPLDRVLDPLGGTTEEVLKSNCTHGSKCQIEVTWDQPAALYSDIHLFYAMGPFYQNYNNYLKSEVPMELMGHVAPDAMRELKCPERSREADGKQIVPCGMKAFSFFNDTFEVHGHTGLVEIDASSAGWDSDLDRYDNPPDYGKRSGTTWLYDRYPRIKHIAEEGVNNRQFVEWMRPGALWRVWHKYGTLAPQDGKQTLKKGDKLTITIHNYYPTPPNGYKHLALTTLSRFGGRGNFFSSFLYAASVLCLFLGIAAYLLRKSRRDLLDLPPRATVLSVISPRSGDSREEGRGLLGEQGDHGL